jgi:hypothetical protein
MPDEAPALAEAGEPAGPQVEAVAGPAFVDSPASDSPTSPSADASIARRININTAPAEVLACLEGIDLTAAQSLVAHRQSVGGFSHPVALLRAPGMTVDRLRPILGRLTADSDTWRILAEGTVPDRDTRVRVEEVVRLDLTRCTTLSHREDDL